jgi:hypothetical protein
VVNDVKWVEVRGELRKKAPRVVCSCTRNMYSSTKEGIDVCALRTHQTPNDVITGF